MADVRWRKELVTLTTEGRKGLGLIGIRNLETGRASEVMIPESIFRFTIAIPRKNSSE